MYKKTHMQRYLPNNQTCNSKTLDTVPELTKERSTCASSQAKAISSALVDFDAPTLLLKNA
jgi:hypothetical protein